MYDIEETSPMILTQYQLLNKTSLSHILHLSIKQTLFSKFVQNLPFWGLLHVDNNRIIVFIYLYINDVIIII